MNGVGLQSNFLEYNMMNFDQTSLSTEQNARHLVVAKRVRVRTVAP